MVNSLTGGVLDALRDAGLDDGSGEQTGWSDIAVAFEDGMVALTGRVESEALRAAAERAVKSVHGVRTVANDLIVGACPRRTDTDIAREALHRLRNNVAVPEDVQAVVTDGFITLDGIVRWPHQREAAESAVKYIHGVKGVVNEITLAPAARYRRAG